MADYIEREAAFNTILKLVPKVDDDGYCWVIRGDAAKAVDSIPAADVAPIRHGRWELDVLDGTPGYRPVCIVCSECHRISYAGFPHCPYCGCRMDLEVANER